MTGPLFSADRIAQLMADSPERVIRPTPEQINVIEQPLGGSVLVIAGAGSGKTETMANRVVWLVANGLVTPSQVLGLTFTRKAAGELNERITLRLQRFAERLSQPEVWATLSDAERVRSRALSTSLAEGLELPEVSTYNAFASSVVQEFGAFAGIAANGNVVDAATAWGIARRVVCASDDPALTQANASISKLVSQTLRLDHAVADNLTSFDDIMRVTERMQRLGQLPYNDKRSEGRYAGIDTMLDNMQATQTAVALARQFANEKRERGLVEFSDQLALAVKTLIASPSAIRVLKERTPVVLLDEVQDTSVGQTKLLSMIFAGSSVMAVGDPHQSIYGFRGASANNLRSFHSDFAGHSTRSVVGTTLTLSTSWRNPTVVLEAANTVSEPLARKLRSEAPDLSVKPLTSRAQYLGSVEDDDILALQVRWFETIDQEFAAVAEWMREARNDHLMRHDDTPTAAVVMRSRAHMPALSAALWQAGVPNRIVGIGGLLTTPEVTDLVCLLRCIWFADAASELLRLLAGPKFRIGVADLQGLAEAARWFSNRDHAQQRIDASELSTGTLPDFERQATLLDAIDEIAAMKRLDHASLQGISEVGRSRLREAGQMLRSLRQEVGGDISALVRAAIHALQLDIELDAAEHTAYEGSAVARANLDAFAEQVEGFLAHDDEGTLASLLAWLDRATEDDEAPEHVPEPEPGTVQLTTVHGAKGLEWDLVAVPRLVEGEFPSSPREGDGWLRAGQLPDELRGDAAARPRLDLSLAETQKDVLDSIDTYKAQLRERHGDEERRLAYVAFTRAAERLMLSYSFWGGQTRARVPAPYLRELSTAGVIDEIPFESAHELDPSERQPRTLVWPSDPLGSRHEPVHLAAQLLRQTLELDHSEGEQTQHPVVRLLLAEREAALSPARATAPEVDRLTASTFHEFIENPVLSERRRLRPMPMRPYRRTRTGNLFHEWVERRASTALGTSLTLAGLEAEPDPAAQLVEPIEEMQTLIDNFEQSRWAELKPIAVELEITIPFAGRTLVCKLDAVYRYEQANEVRYEIVDWKSGRLPKNDEERATRFLQLDLYRQAFAIWSGIDATLIDVTLFYVAEGQELRGLTQRSLQELERLWKDASHSLPGT